VVRGGTRDCACTTTPTCSSRWERRGQLAFRSSKPNVSVPSARCVDSAWTGPLRTGSTTGFGVGRTKSNAARPDDVPYRPFDSKDEPGRAGISAHKGEDTMTMSHSNTCDYLVRHRGCDCRLSTIDSECQQGQHANCDGGGIDNSVGSCSCDCHTGAHGTRQASSSRKISRASAA
jgi:hypothetical protein